MSSTETISSKKLLICSILGIAIVISIALIQPHKPKIESQPGTSAIKEAIAKIPETFSSRKIEIQHWQSSLGVPVYFVSTPELPALDISLHFNGGTVRDDDKAGLAALTASLLETGTTSKSADDIARLIEQSGSVFYTYTTKDQTAISLRTLSDKEHLQPSIDLLTEIISQPAFSKNEFQRLKNRQLTNIQYLEKNPDYLGFTQLNQFLFPDHPYANSDEGTEQTLKTIDVKDVRNFHKQYYVARNLSIALTGNITREQAERFSEQISLSMPIGTIAEKRPVTKVSTLSLRLHIPMDIEQVHIFMGARAIDRLSPDYPALYMANIILGDTGLSSILMDRLREQLGLVYHTNSYLNPMLYGGSFVLSAQTKADQTQQTIKEMQSLLEQFVATGPTEQQLTEAKKQINGRFPSYTASNAAIIGLLGEMGAYQLPLDELDRFIRAVNDLSIQDIKEAVARTIHPDQVILITVGPEQGKTGL